MGAGLWGLGCVTQNTRLVASTRLRPLCSGFRPHASLVHAPGPVKTATCLGIDMVPQTAGGPMAHCSLVL